MGIIYGFAVTLGSVTRGKGVYVIITIHDTHIFCGIRPDGIAFTPPLLMSLGCMTIAHSDFEPLLVLVYCVPFVNNHDVITVVCD